MKAAKRVKYESVERGLVLVCFWIEGHSRDTFHTMCGGLVALADRQLDGEVIDAGPDEEFEPIFGARISRRLAQLGKSLQFSQETMRGNYILV